MTAIISDMHFGVHGDSNMWHNSMLEYSKWLCELLTDRGVSSIWILGDVFDNRKNVGVETLAMANKFFGNLSKFDITIIVGNHDSFFEDNAKTSSVSLLDGWDNIKVIDSVTKFPFGSTNVLACPWGTDLNSDSVAELAKDCEITIGHFAISSFADVPGHISTNGYTPENVSKYSKLVFSGHFHLRDEKKFTFNGEKKRIIIVGSPYQLTWADADSTKGVYFIDEDLNVSFVENTISPKHVQISVDDEVSKESINNNIIRVVATTVEDAKKIQGRISEISDFGALDVGAKINTVEGPTKEVELQTNGGLDHHALLNEYIKACGFENEEHIMDINNRIYSEALGKVIEK